jgi:hypothetical protein
LFKTPLSKEEQAHALREAQAIASLCESEGWPVFLKAVSDLIARETPRPEKFTADEAIQIASKMTYIAGIKRCLQVITQAQDKIQSK